MSDVGVFAGPAAERAGSRLLPGGQVAGSNGQQAFEPAVPNSWVAVLSGEEELHRLHKDDGIPLRLEGRSHHLLQSAAISSVVRAAAAVSS